MPRLLVLVIGIAGVALQAVAQAPVINLIRPSVVKLQTTVHEQDPFSGIHQHTWGGSGVVIARRGSTVEILTNRHVADRTWWVEDKRWCQIDRLEIDCAPEFVGDQETVVAFSDSQTSAATLRWSSTCTDLAVVEATTFSSTVTPARLSTKVAVGDEVFALGHPMGLDYTLTKGIVSALRRVTDGRCTYAAIQTDAKINPGNSGGGLFASDGSLIGINSWKISSGEGLGFAIAISQYYAEVGTSGSSTYETTLTGMPSQLPTIPAAAAAPPYLWVGKFRIRLQSEGEGERQLEVTDALGIYSEADFEIARNLEVDARKSLIREFLLRRYGGKARVLGIELLDITKQKYTGR